MIITLDAETFYDDDFTLKKLTTEAYIRDPRFQTLLWAVKINDKPAIYRSPEVLLTDTRFRQAIENNAVLCHHAHFDGLILSHHFGLKPKVWLDTLSMARFLHGPSAPLSLGALAEQYALRGKTIDYESFKGRRLEELTPYDLSRLGAGAARDADTTYDLFCAMAREFPAVEYPIIDLTIRMFTEPKLHGDAELFASIRDSEFLSKNERLYELGVGESDLQSTAKFCALLEAEGVDIEYKEGTALDSATGERKQIPAIAKTDSFMRSLCDSEDKRVGTLANARLEVRSTIAETRAGRLYGMAERGPLTIYLYYCGAHTRRWSGGDATNFQNLSRGSELRRGIKSPEGFLLASPDQSQGECRILNWLAGQEDVLERFRRGEDPYIPIASKFYGREITKADTAERGFGKQSELSCGFGCGWAKFQTTAYRGTYGPSIKLSDDDAKSAIDLYRSEHPLVTKLWDEGTWAIRKLHDREDFTWRILTGRDGKLHHPNGTWLTYSGLFWDAEWKLKGRRGGWSKMYGSKLVENVVQWLSRIVTCEAMMRFKAAGVPIVGMAHDDVWLLVNQCDSRDQLEELKRKIAAMMAVTPTWAPGLPLAADCKIGATYS